MLYNIIRNSHQPEDGDTTYKHFMIKNSHPLGQTSATSQKKSYNASGLSNPIKTESRRATHNEIERRRRNKINNWIVEIGELIPEDRDSPLRNESTSKTSILSRACQYIVDLKESNIELAHEVSRYRVMYSSLEEENVKIKEELKRMKKDTEKD